MQPVWREIERAPASAAAIVWKKCFGTDFDTVAVAMLRKTDRQASSIPCPDRCGCGHRVVPNGRAFVGVCDCEDESCDDLTLTAEDIAVWEVNRERMGRAIAKALGCEPKLTDFVPPHILQIASFGPTSLPVMLVMARDRGEFYAAVVEMVARLGEHFVVLAPTRRFFNAKVQELLNGAHAGFFDLEAHVRIAQSGGLQSNKSGGELFSPFLRSMNEPASDDEARRLFALLKQLDEGKVVKAPVIQVFRLYCVEGLSRSKVAGKCGCAASLVTLRLKEIEKKLGRKAVQLRELSSHFEKIEESLTDDRARKVRRGSAIDDDRFEDHLD
jgi:hypothetical protein